MHIPLLALAAGLILSFSVPVFALGSAECIPNVSSDALNTLKAGVRSEKSRGWILSRARNLKNTARKAYASWLVGKRLSPQAQEAIIRAHKVGRERGYFRYTRADLALKARILSPHFSRLERRWLMEFGAVGGMDIENVIELPRYSTRVTLTDEREFQAYAEAMLAALSHVRSDFKSKAAVTDDILETLTRGGIDRDDARKIVRSMMFDEIRQSKQMDEFEIMVREKIGSRISEDVQKEAIEDVIAEGSDSYISRGAFEDYLQTFGVSSDIIDLLLDTQFPQSIRNTQEIDTLLEVMRKLENIYVSRLSEQQYGALSKLMELRGGSELGSHEGRFAQALLEFVDFDTRDASSIVNFLSRRIAVEELKDEELDDEELEFLAEFLELALEKLKEVINDDDDGSDGIF